MKTQFPNRPEFEYALSTLVRNKPSNLEDYYEFEICKKQKLLLHTGDKITQLSRALFYRKDSRIQFNSILKIISEILTSNNLAVNDNIAQIVLYLYSFIPRKEHAVEKINNFLSPGTKADLNQFLVFPFRNPNDYNLKIGDFQVSKLNHLQIKRYCEKIGSNFFDLYGERLSHNLNIKRDFFTINLIDLSRITELGTTNQQQVNESLHCYFEELSNYYFQDFDYSFSKSQNLMTFLNDDYIDIYNWAKLSTWQLSIFLNMGLSKKEGFVIPQIMSASIDLANSDIRYKELIKTLQTTYGDNIIDNITDHYALEKFLTFSANAKRFIQQGKISEGFLHYVIALDLIFGEKDNSTYSITTKVAICIFKELNISYHQAVQLVKHIYNKRSYYVHAGEIVSNKDIGNLELVNRTIFYVLIRVISKEWDIDAWLKRLNVLISMFEAEMKIPNKEFVKVGIIKF